MAWTDFIPAVGSLVGSVFNTASTGNQNRKNRQFTAEQNAINRQQTWDMWNATNEFNLKTSDPAFIMQRLKNAGMNPWLALGDPKDVQASNMSTDQAPPPPGRAPQIDLNEAYQAFMQARLQEKQLKLLDSQIENQKADTQLKETNANQSEVTASSILQDTNQKAQLFGGQLIGQGLDNQFKGIMNEYQQNASNKVLKEIDNLGVQMNKSNQEIQNMKQNIAESLVRIENLRKQGKYIEAQTEGQNLLNKITDSTSDSKIQAEKAKNELLRDTDGLSSTSLMNLPSIIAGFLGHLSKGVKYPVKK